MPVDGARVVLLGWLVSGCLNWLGGMYGTECIWADSARHLTGWLCALKCAIRVVQLIRCPDKVLICDDHLRAVSENLFVCCPNSYRFPNIYLTYPQHVMHFSMILLLYISSPLKCSLLADPRVLSRFYHCQLLHM